MDTKSFMLDFFTYIIHSRKITLTKKELKLMEFICHTNTREDFLLNYLISFVDNKLSNTLASSSDDITTNNNN